MKDFKYYAPVTIQEALALKAKFKDSSRILAGGTDLIVQMKTGRAEPFAVIDIKKIAELNRLEWKEGEPLFIGAAVPLNRVIGFEPVARYFNILREACGQIGSLQLRNRGTIGGNICNAAPSADSAPPLLCLDAMAVLANASGTRKIALSEFFSGPGKTTIADDEILLGTEIPNPDLHASGSFLRHTPRQDMDISVTCAASYITFHPGDYTCKEAKIAIGAVTPTPIRVPEAEKLLKGQIITADLIEAAATKAAAAAQPISDIRGSADYRREMAGVLTSRTLKTAVEGYIART